MLTTHYSCSIQGQLFFMFELTKKNISKKMKDFHEDGYLHILKTYCTRFINYNIFGAWYKCRELKIPSFQEEKTK